MANTTSHRVETSSVKLRRQSAHVPITAATVYTSPGHKAYVLAGEHGVLAVYNTERCLHRVDVFADQPIHGLSLQGRRVLLWGACSVALLDVGLDDGDVSAGPPKVLARGPAPDWVHDGLVASWDEDLVMLVNAHNEVLRMKSVGGRLITEGHAVSPLRTMLYAARMAWSSGKSVLVAAGTVFGDILVWKGVDDETPTMLAILRGHEGSIYGVDISSEFLHRGKAMRLLISCSDDRTVRAWDISTERVLQPDVRDTGFNRGSIEGCATADANKDNVIPVAVAMGHASRIWGVKFAMTRHGMFVYSFGEDATAQKWQLDLETGTFVPSRTYALHDGKHLWARSVHVDGAVRILTGGADGKISLIEEAVGASLTAQLSLSEREVLSRYDFARRDTMLAVTNFGRLFLGDLTRNTWKEIMVQRDDLRGCHVLRSIGHDAIVMGTTEGNVYFWNMASRAISICARVLGRIVEISRISDVDDDGAVEVVVHVYGSPCSTVLTLDVATGLPVHEARVRELDERFVPVSTARLDNFLIMGSRHGYIALLTLQNEGWSHNFSVATHSRDAITSIVPLPPGAEKQSRYILATSRDGMYRIYKVDARDLTLLHETAPPFGPMIEGAWFTADPMPELLLYGFRSKRFVVWNESRRQEVVSVDCGGAHRTFRLWHGTADAEQLRFAFTRASRLLVHSQNRVEHRNIKSGMHGREIRALSCNGRLVASGAEDTCIRIWQYTDGAADASPTAFRSLACMKAHVTGIQKLHWFEADYLLSGAGNGELFVWRVRRLDSAYSGLAVVREATLVDESPMKDLRIMDIDVMRLRGAMIVSLAFSNSVLKTFEYNDGGGFKLLSSGSYTGACLTQLRCLHQEDTDGLVIMTASTDGRLVLWRTKMEAMATTNRYEAVAATAVHQSSIKSLDMIRDGHVYRILTGGDDNAIGITVLKSTAFDMQETSYEFAAPVLVHGAHAAAVNGVTMLAVDNEERLGVSVSNDQRIKVWRIGRDRPSLMASACSGVADAGDVAVIDGGLLVLGGVGVETWRVETEKGRGMEACHD